MPTPIQYVITVNAAGAVSGIRQLGSELDDTERKAKRVAGEARKSLTAVGSTIKDVGRGMTAVGTSLTTYVTLPITAVGTAAFMAGRAVDDALADIRRRTGQTGEVLAGLQASFRSVWRDVPESAAEVAEVISQLNIRVGLTGDTLEVTSRRLLEYARINREDVSTSVRTIATLMNALELDASTVVPVLDKLTFASQRSGIGVNALAEAVIGGGMSLVELGYDLDRSIALFAQFERVGAKPADVLNGLRIVLTRLAAEGFTNAQSAFAELIRRIGSTEDSLDGVRLATEAFGAQVAAQLSEEIRYGTFVVDELADEVRNVGNVVRDTAAESVKFDERIRTLGKGIAEALLPFGEQMLDLFERHQPTLQRVIGSVSGVTARFAELSPSIQTSIIAVAAIVAGIGPLVAILGGVVTAIGGGIAAMVNLAIAIMGPTAALAAVKALGAGLLSLIAAGGPIAAAVLAIGLLISQLYALYQAKQEAIRAEGEMQVALQGMEAGAIRAYGALREQGVIIERGTRTTEEWIQAMALASQTLNWFTRESERAGQSALTGGAFIVESFQKASMSAEELAAAQRAMAAESANAEQRAVALAAAQAQAEERARQLAEAQAAVTAAWQQAFQPVMNINQALQHAADQLRTNQVNADSLTGSLGDAIERIYATRDAIVTVPELNPMPPDVTSQVLRDLDATRDRIVRTALDGEAANRRAAEEAQRTYNGLFASLERRSADMWADMLGRSQSSAVTIGNALTNAFNTAFSTIMGRLTAHLITPFQSAFNEMLDNLSGNVIGRLLGPIEKNLSGLLNKIPGLGGAAGAAANVGGGAASAVGSGAAGGGGMMSSLGAFFTNPLTIGIGAALAGLFAVTKIGQGRRTANEWVNNIENPFWKHFIDITQGERILQSNNIADISAAGAMLRDLNEWFLGHANDFRSKGDIQRTVIDQSLNNTQPNVNRLLVGMRARVQALGGVPQFETGTDWVPRKMLAILHPGEAVLTREENRSRLSGGATIHAPITVNIHGISGRDFEERGVGQQIGEEIANKLILRLTPELRRGGYRLNPAVEVG